MSAYTDAELEIFRDRGHATELYDAAVEARSALAVVVAKMEALAARYASDAAMYEKAAADAERMCVGAGSPLRAGFGCSRAFARELRSLLKGALHAQALETGRVE